MSTKLDFKPWKTMWTRPAETVRSIVDANPRYMLWLLYFLSGGWWCVTVFGAQPLVITIAAFVTGFIHVELSSLLCMWVGRRFAGKASFSSVRASIAWSSIVQIPFLVVWFLGFFFPENILMNLILIGQPLFIILYLWGVWMFVWGYAEVQAFSKLKAFGVLLVAMALPYLILYGFFIMFNAMDLISQSGSG